MKIQTTKNSCLFDKYKTYFESWLNLPIEFIMQTKGIHLSTHKIRREKPKGSYFYLPVCAFETERALLISCVPEWESKLRELLADAKMHEAISKLKNFSIKGAFISPQHHNFYGLSEPNTRLDTSKAVCLEKQHCNKFLDYYKKLRPHMCEYQDSDNWMPQAYEEMINKSAQFCVFDNGEIVCATDAEDMHNKPDSVINLGINTLPDFRRKGYATIACAAFIRHYTEQGVFPVWQCNFNNSASRSLAQKLGFTHLGNVFYLAASYEQW